jgi:hypothetical protein
MWTVSGRFVTPLVFPSFAPEIHPALEGLFNIVIAWGALFSGFLSDSRKPPMLPFCIGSNPTLLQTGLPFSNRTTSFACYCPTLMVPD